MRGEKKIFTAEEKKYIVDNWETSTPGAMRKIFHCSWDAIANVGKEYNLETAKPNLWTEEEINTLKELATIYDHKKIALLMNKSENAIYIKANRMHIPLYQNRRKWTIEDENELRELWGNKSIEVISKILHRSIFSIKVKANRMKLGAFMNNTEYLLISEVSELLNVSLDRIYSTWIQN